MVDGDWKKSNNRSSELGAPYEAGATPCWRAFGYSRRDMVRALVGLSLLTALGVAALLTKSQVACPKWSAKALRQHVPFNVSPNPGQPRGVLTWH